LISYGGWALFAVAVVVAIGGKADGSFSLASWDRGSLRAAVQITTVAFAFAVVGVVSQLRRTRRQSDTYYRPLFTLGGASLVAVVLYFLVI